MRSLVIFHRHGHRAPAHNVYRSADEVALWSSLAVKSQTLERLSASVCVENDPINPPPRDSLTAPFGMLTERGQLHLQQVGHSLRQLFKETIEVHRLRCFSTNYVRTQVSAQSLMVGLLGLEDDNTPSTIQPQAQQHTIRVRPMSTCSLSFFDGQESLAESLIKRAQDGKAFRELNSHRTIAEVVSTMRRQLQHVDKPDGTFNWLSCFDYFVCRREHGLAVSPGLADLDPVVAKIITTRYKIYFEEEPVLLALFVLPMLEELVVGLRQGRLTLFSCHDVNVIALLFAFKYPALLDPDSSFWPGYGSTLSFESRHDEVSAYFNGACFAQFTITQLEQEIMQPMRKTSQNI